MFVCGGVPKMLIIASLIVPYASLECLVASLVSLPAAVLSQL